HTEGRAVSRTEIRCAVPGLQGVRAPLAVSRPTSGRSGPAHAAEIATPHIRVRRPLSGAFGRGRMGEGGSMAPGRPSPGEGVVKTMVTHTVTYFLIGWAAFWSLGYARTFAEPGVRPLMRQADEPLVMAGPLFQPIRGLLFGLAFYPLRGPLFGARAGWLV